MSTGYWPRRRGESGQPRTARSEMPIDIRQYLHQAGRIVEYGIGITDRQRDVGARDAPIEHGQQLRGPHTLFRSHHHDQPQA